MGDSQSGVGRTTKSSALVLAAQVVCSCVPETGSELMTYNPLGKGADPITSRLFVGPKEGLACLVRGACACETANHVGALVWTPMEKSSVPRDSA